MGLSAFYRVRAPVCILRRRELEHGLDLVGDITRHTSIRVVLTFGTCTL